MPDAFRQQCTNRRIIADCTEVIKHTLSSLDNKSLLYSDYKFLMTFRGQIGISPAAVTIFVSDLWVGSGTVEF